MIHVKHGGPPETARAGPGRRASGGRKAHFRRAGDKNPSGAEMKAEEDRGGSSTWDSFAGGPDAATARVREPYPAGRRSRAALVHGVGAPIRRRVVRAGSGLPGRVMLVHDTSADRTDAAQVRPEQHDGETRGRRTTCTTRCVSRRCTRDGLHAPGVDGPRHHAPRYRHARLVFAASPPLSSTRLQGRTVPTPSIRDSRDRCRGGEDHHVDSRETRRTSLRSPRRRDIRGPQCRILLSQ